MDLFESQKLGPEIKILKEQSLVVAENETKKYIKAEANNSPEYQMVINDFAKHIFLKNFVSQHKGGVALSKDELIFLLDAFKSY